MFRFLVGPSWEMFSLLPDSAPDDRQLVNPTVRSQEEGAEEPRRSQGIRYIEGHGGASQPSRGGGAATAEPRIAAWRPARLLRSNDTSA